MFVDFPFCGGFESEWNGRKIGSDREAAEEKTTTENEYTR